ncbi:mannan-binding lectin [Coxiella burnetii]|uniref:mannan-binding lectin n=1 Tax=Coxiella burnetii TaxID=777 RepID=UPI0000ED0303|nr:mannan-binding lectin [Coxiella burnetii]AIT63281.1 Mannan-binding protein [Coxiella burnetii str. Namibia]ATN85871.1 hypothetical protein AYO29_05095 [Coxiella burnetii str. Schperling]EDR35555.1 hypothetical protein COXBURSA334_1177 [Coxiella burnetii Q321]PHH56553.1 hypothetical protein CRH12_10250 [Coxiella burnetii]UYK68946.1 mannan-binding lectin [Coxiella burnetii]
MKHLFLGISLLISSSFAFAFNPFSEPVGNYRQSCSACQVFNDQLSCLCKDRQGIPHQTSLRLSPRCRFVENINGQLQCTRYRPRYPHHYRFVKDFPAGPIWNQADAQNKCPPVCASHGARWTGNWHTVREGRQSVCQCRDWSRWSR